MAKAKKCYPVTYSHDGTWWVAEVTDGLDGVVTQGRMIESARTRLREAIQAALDLDAPYDGELVEKFAVPARLDARLGKLREGRKVLNEHEQRIRALTRSVVGELLGSGLSVRDVGELAGISHARVQQLAQEARAGVAAGKGTTAAYRSERSVPKGRSKDVFVQSHAGGGWEVRGPGKRAARVTDTKKEAVDYARGMARKEASDMAQSEVERGRPRASSRSRNAAS
jgi:predicted RNase H-like HicB family nuclease